MNFEKFSREEDNSIDLEQAFAYNRGNREFTKKQYTFLRNIEKYKKIKNSEVAAVCMAICEIL